MLRRWMAAGQPVTCTDPGVADQSTDQLDEVDWRVIRRALEIVAATDWQDGHSPVLVAECSATLRKLSTARI